MKFILKSKGTITILSPCPEIIEKYAKEYKFSKEKEYEIDYMHQNFFILKFIKAS